MYIRPHGRRSRFFPSPLWKLQRERAIRKTFSSYTAHTVLSTRTREREKTCPSVYFCTTSFLRSRIIKVYPGSKARARVVVSKLRALARRTIKKKKKARTKSSIESFRGIRSARERVVAHGLEMKYAGIIDGGKGDSWAAEEDRIAKEIRRVCRWQRYTSRAREREREDKPWCDDESNPSSKLYIRAIFHSPTAFARPSTSRRTPHVQMSFAKVCQRAI